MVQDVGLHIERMSDDWLRGATRIWAQRWGEPLVVSRGKLHDLRGLPGFVAENGHLQGVATYRVDGQELEVVSLVTDEDSDVPGVGTALLAAVEQMARERGLRRAWLVTTNDNTDAIAFYEAMGWQHIDTYQGAVRQARAIKPSIPDVGANGVAIEDELEFEWRPGMPGASDR